MNGTFRVRHAARISQNETIGTGYGTVLGRGSFLGHGFRVTRGPSPDEARVEVYSCDRWWVMARVSGLSDSVLSFEWDRAWLRVGRPWRDGVEAAVRDILVGVRDAV